MKKKRKPHWHAHVIEGGELSVIWSEYKFGHQSWGWEDDRKIVLSDLSERPPVFKRILIHAAKKLATHMNKHKIVPAKPWNRDGEH